MFKSGMQTIKLPETIKEKYAEVIKCSNGYYNVRLNRRWGYIDGDGNEITPLKYESSADFNETGKALVRRDREFFYIDEAGKEHDV